MSFFVVYWSYYTSQAKKYIMSSKKTNKWSFFSLFLWELKDIFFDILFVYKNFLHFCISRVCISLWGIVLSMLVALPIFLFWIVLWMFDWIAWLDIVKTSLDWTDPTHSGFLESIAMHPYALVAMILVMLTALFFSLLAWSYTTFLLARLAVKYTQGKRLDYKKNLYFSRKHITTFLSLICWNMVYILAFLFIGFSFILAVYILSEISFISENTSTVIIAIISLTFLLLTSYVIYRILFGYVIIATIWKHHELKSARSYLHKSIAITKGTSFFKFIVVVFIYSMLMLPFKSLDTHIDNTLVYMKDTLAFNTGLVWNLEPEQLQYYEYITAEYSDLSNDEIVDKIVFLTRVKILYFFISYFLFSGLFIVIITSFYIRVLEKNNTSLKKK